MFQEAISRYLQSSGYSRIQLKSVLFDMDGVLFNSMPYHADAWHKVICMKDEPELLLSISSINGNMEKMPLPK